MSTIWRRLIAALALAWVLCHAAVARAQLLSPGPLSKAHQSLEGDQHCNDCHTTGKRVEPASCNRCHTDLASRMDRGLGLHGRNYKGKPCEGCHVEHLGQGSRIVRWPNGDQKSLDHALTGWPLQNAHKSVECAKCHTKTNARGAATFLGLQTACNSCHKDQHDGRFGTVCTNCHNDTTWKQQKLDGFDHNLARFALKGMHQPVPCAKCHQDPPKYVGLEFSTCTNCHKDPHAGKLGPTCTNCHSEAGWKKLTMKGASHPGVSLGGGHAAVACGACHDKGNSAAPSRGSECASCHQSPHKAPFGRGCISCHSSIQWMGLPRAIGVSSHAKTSFALTGRHQDTSCAGCHKPELPREARYRKLAFALCQDCHKDEHQGEFAARQKGECAQCHSTAGFRPTLFGVTAHASTKFPLVGLHTAVGCTGCHAPAKPRVDLHVGKQACADCHQNPHGNQFEAEMKQGGCARCHEATGWHNPKIDHTTWPLTGAHATAACESCHSPSAADRVSGKGASYRGVPRACAGCHDDVHAGQFKKGAAAVACDRCHTTKIFKLPDFDHAKLAQYPLTGGHAKLACAKCHATQEIKVKGVPASVVRYALPSSECTYCHANPHSDAPARGAR